MKNFSCNEKELDLLQQYNESSFKIITYLASWYHLITTWIYTNDHVERAASHMNL